MHTQILIIGSGPAGLTAALYTALAGFQTTVLMGSVLGGQLTLTNAIENFPGIPHIAGIDLTQTIQEQAKQAGALFLSEQVDSVLLNHYPFQIKTKTQNFTADSLIIATGAGARWLHVPGEDKFKGHGVSICATCDGYFYRNKTIAVVGGCNSAIYEALLLSQTTTLTYLIMRESSPFVDQSLKNQLAARHNIIVIPQTRVLAFFGKAHLTHVLIQNTESGKKERLRVDGVFEAIGRFPDSALFKKDLKLDSNGYIITDCRTGQTSQKGVFACGDVSDPFYHQALLACSSGCRAALSAKKFLLSASL